MLSKLGIRSHFVLFFRKLVPGVRVRQAAISAAPILKGLEDLPDPLQAGSVSASTPENHTMLGNQDMEKLQSSSLQSGYISFHEFRAEVFRILTDDFQWHGGGNIRLFEQQEEMVRKAFYNGDHATGTAQAVFEDTIRRPRKR